MSGLHKRIVESASAEPQNAVVLRLVLLIAALACAAFSRPVKAYYLPLIFSPSAPTEIQIAQVILRVGQCDLLTVFSPQERIVTIVGRTVRVEVDGFSNGITGDICNFPPATVPVDLIPLAAGSYTVEIYRRSVSGPPSVDLMVSGTLQVLPAATSQPVSIPAVSARGLASAVLLMLIVGWGAGRRSAGT